MDDTGQKLALLARDRITGTAKVFTFGITLRPTAVFESDILGENLNPTCVRYQRNKKQVRARIYETFLPVLTFFIRIICDYILI